MLATELAIFTKDTVITTAIWAYNITIRPT